MCTEPMKICIGREVGAMKTFLDPIRESGSLDVGLGLGVGQCKHTIMAYLHRPTTIPRPDTSTETE